MDKMAERTIIKNIGAYEDYPFENLDVSALKLLKSGNAELPIFYQKRFSSLRRAFECYLQITDQRITALDFSHRKFRGVCTGFLGSLYSEKFIQARPESRYAYAKTFVELLSALKQQIPALVEPDINLSVARPTSQVKNCVEQFEKLNLNKENVWLWTGWYSNNRLGKVYILPFYPIHRRLGRNFTQKLYETCDDYFSSRKAVKIECIAPLAQFIGHYSGKLEASYFQDPLFVTRFWRDFFTYYVRTGYKKGIRISTLITAWRSSFLYFVMEYLTPSGLIAEPFGELPNPESKIVSGVKTHLKISKSGVEINTKLLTDIPLHVTDDVAKKLLFGKIQEDFDTIVAWAEREVSEMWQRYQRRLQLESLGCARIINDKIGVNTGAGWLTSGPYQLIR